MTQQKDIFEKVLNSKDNNWVETIEEIENEYIDILSQHSDHPEQQPAGHVEEHQHLEAAVAKEGHAEHKVEGKQESKTKATKKRGPGRPASSRRLTNSEWNFKCKYCFWEKFHICVTVYRYSC